MVTVPHGGAKKLFCYIPFELVPLGEGQVLENELSYFLHGGDPEINHRVKESLGYMITYHMVTQTLRCSEVHFY